MDQIIINFDFHNCVITENNLNLSEIRNLYHADKFTVFI